MDSRGRARLVDFGVSRVLYSTACFTQTTSVRGTFRWMAPELLQCIILGGTVMRPNIESDVYALAMTSWEVSNHSIHS